MARFLTPQETVELARIQQDSSVVGYALIGFDGEELESSGHWSASIAAVFANVLDLSDKIGEELGEESVSPIMFLDSPDFEVAGISLSACRAVVIKRKQRLDGERLRSVS